MIFEKMRPEELTECALLAADAFTDYEYFSDYIPDEKKRRKFLKNLILAEFRANSGSADFIVAKDNGNITAVAMLCEPGYIKPTDGEYIKNGFLKCYTAGFKAVSEWNAMDKKAGAPCHEIGNAWYISLLTVSTKCKGTGIGSCMLKESIIPYVKEHGGTTLTLFTNSQENRSFYEKNGFRQFHEQFFEYKEQRLGSWSYKMKLV